MPTSPTSPDERGRPADGRGSGARGFTLVELLVVLVLLAAAAFLVMPRLAPPAPPPPEEALRLRLLAALEEARRRAIFEGRPVLLDPRHLAGTPAVGVEWTPAAGSGPLLLFAPDGTSGGGRLRLPDGGRILVDPAGGIRRDDG